MWTKWTVVELNLVVHEVAYVSPVQTLQMIRRYCNAQGIFAVLIAYLHKNSKFRVNTQGDIWGTSFGGGRMLLLMSEMRQTAALRTLRDKRRLLCGF